MLIGLAALVAANTLQTWLRLRNHCTDACKLIQIRVSEESMGRPKASHQNRDFAIAFADLVTIDSPGLYDWVARTGEYSIFTLLSRVAPNVSHGMGTMQVSLF